MAGQIKVSTDQVAAIATKIESINNQLNDQLTNGQNAIKGLASTWEGEASQTTISSFNEFAQKYFQNYKDIIDNYVRFLRTNVDQGYFETETANTGLADAFK
jgi:WXG100 family type VII secretion target